MNKKSYVSIVMLVLLSIVLAACGGTAVTATQAPATQPPAATEAPTSAPTEAPTAAPTQCAPADASFDPTAADVGSKSITVAYEQEPDNLTGEYSNMSFAVWIDQIIGAGLAKWDDKNNFVPELAAEIPSADNGGISADGLTITWHLKPCVFWSDGQPITSKDVAFTWKQQVDPANA